MRLINKYLTGSRDKDHFGVRMRASREHAGIRQKEAAERIGITAEIGRAHV